MVTSIASVVVSWHRFFLAMTSVTESLNQRLHLLPEKQTRFPLLGLRVTNQYLKIILHFFKESLFAWAWIPLLYFGKFLEQFFLSCRKLCRGFNNQMNQQITTSISMDVREPFSSYCYYMTALCASRYFNLCRTGEGGNVYNSPQYGLSKANRHLTNYIIIMSLE